MSTGAILNQKQEIDTSSFATKEELSGYVKTSDVATNVTSGNSNPVSSGAVYDYVQSNAGELPWKLLNSRSNIENSITYSVTVNQSIQFLRFHFTGTTTKMGGDPRFIITFIHGSSYVYQVAINTNEVTRIDSQLVTSTWIDYDVNDRRVYGFDNAVLIENNELSVELSIPDSVTNTDITCNIYYM